MTPLRVLVVFLWFAILSAGSYVWTIHTTGEPITGAHPRVDSPSVLDEVVNGAAELERPRDDDWAEPHVDLNGNEVDDAVGDYRIDRHGELYERHAPDTALAHLGSPIL
jgi:hypothetical protein